MTSTQTVTATLYERLGGAEGIQALVHDVVEAHLANPTIAPRFKTVDIETARAHTFEFFASGSGGPEIYTGRDLRTAHTGMNVNETEFVAAVDDVVAVMKARGIGPQEQNEVLGIFFALKGEVLHL